MFNATINFSDQLKFLKELDTVIEEKVKERINSLPVERYESENIKDVSLALSKAQGEFKPLKFNRVSNWFSAEYSDLDNIMQMARPILSKHGLALIFFTQTGEKTMLHTKLLHASGQWFETRARLIPSKDDLKTLESALNHLKRQQAMALLNITLEGDVNDDDAVTDMTNMRKEITDGTPLTKIKVTDPDAKTITKEQLEELEYELTDYPEIAEQMLRAYRIQHIADMPASRFLTAVTKIRELKIATQKIKR